MGEMALDRSDTTSVDAILRDELARENRALSGVAPVAAHLLASAAPSMVSDAIVARLRGMLSSLAEQLLGLGGSGPRGKEADPNLIDSLAGELADQCDLLDHFYAVALEGLLTERLSQQSAIDPVLSPLLQELIASDRPEVAELAMNALAAQSRFMQAQRRMEHALDELPAERFDGVLRWYEGSDIAREAALDLASFDRARVEYSEAKTRRGLLARLTSAMGAGSLAALELEHAGVALFADALASRSQQTRDVAVASCHPGQAARLTLGLCAAGLCTEAMERQLRLLVPAQMFSREFADMDPARARSILLAGAPGGVR